MLASNKLKMPDIVYGMAEVNGQAVKKFIENASHSDVYRYTIYLHMCIKICVIMGHIEISSTPFFFLNNYVQ